MFLPEFDREYLEEKGFEFEEKIEGRNKGLIIKDYPLPAGKFNKTHSDVLIILPQGYPDVRPDMWYFFPHLQLAQGNKVISKTNGQILFAGKTWQRWSRHSNDWRAGIDGLHTFLKRIEHALSVAA